MRPPVPAATACWPSPMPHRSTAAQSPAHAGTAPPHAPPPPAHAVVLVVVNCLHQSAQHADTQQIMLLVQSSLCITRARKRALPPTNSQSGPAPPTHLRPVNRRQAGMCLGICRHLAHHPLNHAACPCGVSRLEQQRGLPQAVACGGWKDGMAGELGCTTQPAGATERGWPDNSSTRSPGAVAMMQRAACKRRPAVPASPGARSAAFLKSASAPW